MNKPQSSLALSLSLVLLQANLLSAMAAEPQGAIWQRMASSGKANATSAPKSAQRVKRATSTAKLPVSRANVLEDSHAMLFLSGKSKAVGAANGASIPTAALTLHPSLPMDGLGAAPIQAASDMPAEEAAPQIAALPSTSAVTAASKRVVAQLAPDQILAQADHSSLTPQPIPPVVTGTLDFEEYKTTNIIDLKVSQSRTFKLKNKIVRTSISDPGIAEPVVVAENQLVLLGKAPGTCTMVLWDDAGNSVALDLRVSKDYAQLQSTLREIDPRIIVKAFSVGGSDRVLLTGDVDHPESIIKAFAASNVFMDDRGMNIQVVNSRIIAGKIGETGGTQTGGGSQSGLLAQIGSVDRYTYFGNLAGNIGKAQVMASDGGRVTSLVKVRKVPLIVLHVTFMEMNTTSARQLATQLGYGMTNRQFSFGIGGSISSAPLANIGSVPGLSQIQSTVPAGAAVNSIPFPTPGGGFLPNPAQPITTGPVIFPVQFSSLVGGVFTPTQIGQGGVFGPSPLIGQSVLFGAPGGTSFDATSNFNIATGTSSFGGKTINSLNPSFQGVIGESRARILAEPTLVTISGERASFLAGGEVPIVQSVAAAGATQASIVFEPFGLRINMIPILMENGSINLEVSPEERIIAQNLAINVAGGSVPGFTTRKTQTIVEMKPGQELYISGLVSTNSGRQITKTPIYGEVPVLGALYRSKAFAKNESELVVAVRPEIILPGTPGQLKLPEEIGRVEGPRDTNMLQVEPTVIDERHYSSGRAERHQKTSPTLPEGAPVPDNE
ncbi:MAG: pilus assembly protein N-terminal domain-containing protein [Cyanobacteria bacterium REEB67]|nr:pilus assembly protein N-terminal domain-containing protein [Cyanobacteria bacterium REEB67]